MPTPLRRPGRLRLLALVAAAAVSPAPDAQATPTCPPDLRGRAAATHLLALINEVRADHGAQRLQLDHRLARVARRHSRDMVVHRYFAHDSRSGAHFSARIARSGWMRARRRWTVGENLAWGTGCGAAPRSIVTAWLRSPSHRRILLARDFKVVGIGIVRGTPFGGAAHRSRTYTADFGT
jgi:uncharacterized protein YkwD